MNPEVRIIQEALKIIFRDSNIDNQFDIELIRFHAKSIETILDKLEKELENLKQWKDD